MVASVHQQRRLSRCVSSSAAIAGNLKDRGRPVPTDSRTDWVRALLHNQAKCRCGIPTRTQKTHESEPARQTPQTRSHLMARTRHRCPARHRLGCTCVLDRVALHQAFTAEHARDDNWFREEPLR